MNFRVLANNKKIFLFVIIVIILIVSLAFNFFVITEKPYFNAEYNYYGDTAYGDIITIRYGGYEYARMDTDYDCKYEGYYVAGDRHPLARVFYYNEYFDSIFNKYTLEGVDGYSEHMFLYCNIGYGHYFYRTDFEFPKETSENIDRIGIWYNDNQTLYIYDNEMIKFFLGEQTKVTHSDVVNYLEKEMKRTLSKEDFFSFAVGFSSYPLERFYGVFEIVPGTNFELE